MAARFLNILRYIALITLMGWSNMVWGQDGNSGQNHGTEGDNEKSSDDKISDTGDDNKGFVEIDNHVFREHVPVEGTDFDLNYTSWRVSDNTLPYRLDVRLFNPDNASVQAVNLRITVTNRTVAYSSAKEPSNLPLKWNPLEPPGLEQSLGSSYSFLWDGYDAASNLLEGVHKVLICKTVTHVEYREEPMGDAGGVSMEAGSSSSGQLSTGGWNGYHIPEDDIHQGTAPVYGQARRSSSINPAVITHPQAPPSTMYAPPSREPITRSVPGSSGRGTISGLGGGIRSTVSLLGRVPYYYALSSTEDSVLGVVYAKKQGLGGWTLRPHHFYDKRGRVLFLGNGDRREADPIKTPRCVFTNTPIPDDGEITIVSKDGSELYMFDGMGKHLRTLNTYTGTTNYWFSYETNGYLKTVCDSCGNMTTVERDPQGNATFIVSPFGLRTRLVLDGNGYLSQVINPAGETNGFRYTNGGLLTNVITRRGYTFNMSYDELGRLVHAEDPVGASNRYSRVDYYSGYEIVDSGTLENQQIYRRNRLPGKYQSRMQISAGDITTETIVNYDDTIVTNRYPDGTIVGIVKGPDPRFEWQAPQIETMHVTLPSGLSWSATVSRAVSLSDTGNVLSLIAQTNIAIVNDRCYTSIYTASNRQVRISSPEGRSYAVAFNTNGYPERLERPGLYPINAAYDSYGRIQTLSQGIGENLRVLNVGYATNGFLTSLTNGLDQIVRIHPDLIGRVTNIIRPDNQSIGVRYDKSSSPSGVTPSGKPEHLMGYTSVGLLDRYSAPGVGLADTNMTLTWSPTRKVTSITRPGGMVITNDYNSADLLSSMQWPEDRIVIQYLPSNKLVSTITADSGAALDFDWDGRLLHRVSWDGVVTGNVEYGWSRDFRLTALTVNDEVIHYGYDRDLLVTNAGNLTIRRDAQMGLITNSVLNNVVDNRRYNGFGEIFDYVSKYKETNLYCVAYEYNKLGLITSRVEKALNATNRFDYTYDPAQQLVEVRTNGAIYSTYKYDANGNRTNTLIGGVSRAAMYDAQDRMLSYGSDVYQYDLAGTLTNKMAGGINTAYRYDARGSLLEARPGTNIICYAVDPLGRRIEKRRNGLLVQRFLYQNFLQPAAELDADGNIVSRFVYALNKNVPDYIVKNGNTYRVIKDHLGSVRLVVDSSSGTIAQQIAYDEFGRITLDTNPGFQPFGFAGGLYDPDTGLVRFGYRDYDAESSRWLSKDPIGLSGGLNLYVYCHNDPINYRDPLGFGELSSDLLGGGLGLGAAADLVGIGYQVVLQAPGWTKVVGLGFIALGLVLGDASIDLIHRGLVEFPSNEPAPPLIDFNPLPPGFWTPPSNPFPGNPWH